MADSKHKVSSGLPVADSVAGCRVSCRFETDYTRAQVASCRFSCRLPIQLPIRNRQVVASCRFRFETDNISLTDRQPASSCKLPIQLPIRNRQVQRMGKLPVADSDSKRTILVQRIGKPIQLPIRNRQNSHRKMFSQTRFWQTYLVIFVVLKESQTLCSGSITLA